MQDYNKAALEKKPKELLASSVEADNKPFLKHIRSIKPARGAAVTSTQSQCKETQGMKKLVPFNDIHRWCLKEEIGIIA